MFRTRLAVLMTSILALGNIIIKNEAKCLLEAVEKLLS